MGLKQRQSCLVHSGPEKVINGPAIWQQQRRGIRANISAHPPHSLRVGVRPRVPLSRSPSTGDKPQSNTSLEWEPPAENACTSSRTHQNRMRRSAEGPKRRRTMAAPPSPPQCRPRPSPARLRAGRWPGPKRGRRPFRSGLTARHLQRGGGWQLVVSRQW